MKTNKFQREMYHGLNLWCIIKTSDMLVSLILVYKFPSTPALRQPWFDALTATQNLHDFVHEKKYLYKILR